MFHVITVSFDVLASHGSLLLDEFVLFGETVSLLAANLLLAELGIVVTIFSDSVQVVLHDLLMSANLIDNLQFLLSKVLVANIHLLLLSFPAFLHSHAILFGLLLAQLILSLLLQHLVIVFLLEFLQLPCLFTRLIDLFDGSHLLVLEHAHAVP